MERQGLRARLVRLEQPAATGTGDQLPVVGPAAGPIPRPLSESSAAREAEEARLLRAQQARIQGELARAGSERTLAELFPHEIARGAPAQARLALRARPGQK